MYMYFGKRDAIDLKFHSLPLHWAGEIYKTLNHLHGYIPPPTNEMLLLLFAVWVKCSFKSKPNCFTQRKRLFTQLTETCAPTS